MYRTSLLIVCIVVAFGKSVIARSDVEIADIIIKKCGNTRLIVEDVAVLERGRVVSLDLTNWDFRSDGIVAIPSEIGMLSELKELIAMNNAIRLIPPEIGNCRNLRVLNLASNNIMTLPPEIGMLEKLEKLDLRHNNIKELPPEIGNCTSIEYLWLWGNDLTSLNPAITRLYRLKELYLKDNRLTTLPVGIIRMRFTYVDLFGNRLCNLSTVLDKWAKRIDDRYTSTQNCWRER